MFSSKAVVWIGQAVDKKAFTIPSFLKPVVDLLCLVTPRMCNDVLELFVGVSHGVNTSRIDVMTAHEPGGTSTLNMVSAAELHGWVGREWSSALARLLLPGCCCSLLLAC